VLYVCMYMLALQEFLGDVKYQSTYLSTFWVLTYLYLSILENWYLVLILKYLCKYL